MIWIVVPAFNEAENLPILIPKILETTSTLDVETNILVVDDGSTDNTQEVLEKLSSEYVNLVRELIPRNRGKALALQIGFRRAVSAGATVVVMMDADGQDDPSELPKLIKALNEGFDLVTGARISRNDRFIKRITSKFFNFVTGAISGTPVKDLNSGFKVMTSNAANEVSPMMYGELHRYITVIAFWLGYRVTELPVAHHERMSGKTKYGINRFWRGFIDLLTVKFLMSYENRPSHLFGGLGFLSCFIGSTMLTSLLILQILGNSIGERPMLIAGVLFFIVGVQLILFGLLAEMVVYTKQQNHVKGPRN